jgi:hypothetical protein
MFGPRSDIPNTLDRKDVPHLSESLALESNHPDLSRVRRLRKRPDVRGLAARRCCRAVARSADLGKGESVPWLRAFSAEVDTGSAQENATSKKRLSES